MEQAAPLRRVHSLKNVNRDPANDSTQGRSHHRVVVRRNSVSELVARYQDVMELPPNQKEKKVLDRRGLQSTKVDLPRSKSDASQVKSKIDFARTRYGENFPLEKNSLRNANRNPQGTADNPGVSPKVQQKSPPDPPEQAQVSSASKGTESKSSMMIPNGSFARGHRDQVAEPRGPVETTIAQGKALKEKATIFNEQQRNKKDNESPGRWASKTRERDRLLPEHGSTSSTRKHCRKALPPLDPLDGGGARRAPLPGQSAATPSVKERSALYLSKAAAAGASVGHKKPEKPKADILSFTTRSQTNKHQSMTREICPACLKPIYSMERLVLDRAVLHQTCFLCKHCHKKLSSHNYAVYNGGVYCKDHHALVTKAEESCDDVFKWKQLKHHRLNKATLSTLEPNLRSQQHPEKSKGHKEEKAESGRNIDAACDIRVPSQIRRLQSEIAGHPDAGRKLRIHWPPLQNPNKNIQSDHNSIVTIRWPPLKSGSTLQTYKETPIKQNVTKKKTPNGTSIAWKSREKQRISVTSVSISNQDDNTSALHRNGEGKRKLQELTQKLKSHNGNVPKQKEGRYGRKIVEKTSTFPHTNTILSTEPKAPTASIPSHLKVLKVTKITNPKPVTDVLKGLSLSAIGNNSYVERQEVRSPSSANTVIPLTKHVKASGIQEWDSKQNTGASLPSSLLGPQDLKETSGERSSSTDEVLVVEEEAEMFSDQNRACREQTGHMAPPCNPADVPDILSLSTIKETVDTWLEGPIVDDTDVGNKYPTQSEANVISRDQPLIVEESGGTHSEKHSNGLEIGKNCADHVFQEATKERKLAASLNDQNCQPSGEKEPYFVDIHSTYSGQTSSNEALLQSQLLTGYNIIPEINKESAATKNLSTLAEDSAAIGKPIFSLSARAFQTRQSTELMDATNIQRPPSQEDIKINGNAIKTSGVIDNPSKKATRAHHRESEDKCDITSFTPQVPGSKGGHAGKEHSIRSTGLGKNPFFRLFPSDAKAGKLKKETASKKKLDVPKSQSALGKIFGLSTGNVIKEEEPKAEVNVSPQMPPQGSFGIGDGTSHTDIGVDDIMHTVRTPKERETMISPKSGRQDQNENIKTDRQEIQLDEPFFNIESQTDTSLSFKDLFSLEPNGVECNTISTNSNCTVNTGKGYDTKHIHGRDEFLNSWPIIHQSPPCSESSEIKKYQNNPASGSLSSEPMIHELVVTMDETINIPHESQNTPEPLIEGMHQLSVQNTETLVHNDASLNQLRTDDHQEVMLHTEIRDLLEVEGPFFPPTLVRNVLMNDLHDSGIDQVRIQPHPNANVCSMHLGDQDSLDSIRFDSGSPRQVNDVPPLLDLASGSGTLCDIDGIDIFHSKESMEPSNAQLLVLDEPEDPFGLGLSFMHHNVVHARTAVENVEGMSQLTSLSDTTENVAEVTHANLSPVAVTSVLRDGLTILDES